MTTRQFDPVLSAALRNELEAMVDAPAAKPATGLLPVLRRPQVWVSIVTAVVLVAATVGVLQVTAGHRSQPAGASRVVDPLSQITDPANGSYVARSVRTLLAARGTGPGTRSFDVPVGVTSMRVYIGCAPKGDFAVGIDGDGKSSGGCERTIGGSFDIPVTAGTHDAAVTVAKGTDYALLIVVSPAPTVATGALIDPLTQVRDLRDPDALTGDTRPLLRMSGTDDSAVRSFTVPAGVDRVRVFLACQPSSATLRVRIDGHVVTGCMNAIAHWFDLSPSSRTITAQVEESSLTAPSAGAWSLLVVPAPAGAKDSPNNTLLPYGTDATGPVLARSRGAGAQTSGTYVGRSDTIFVGVTCRGTGWLEVATPQGSSGRGAECEKSGRYGVGMGGTDEKGKRERWTATPHGDISWTLTISDRG